jgi:hypothetical protein
MNFYSQICEIERYCFIQIHFRPIKGDVSSQFRDVDIFKKFIIIIESVAIKAYHVVWRSVVGPQCQISNYIVRCCRLGVEAVWGQRGGSAGGISVGVAEV